MPFSTSSTAIETETDANTQLHHLKNTLAASQSDFKEFTYSVSHDLKEPLRGIHNYAHILLEDYQDVLDESGQDKLQKVASLTGHMALLLDALLDYSRLGRRDCVKEPSDLNKLILIALETLSLTGETENIKLSIDQNFPTVLCDPQEISEVFRHLISNALKYNVQKIKAINIGWTTEHPRHQGRLVFFVSDNGIGIPERSYDKAFKIFQRLNGREKYGEGLGIGLTFTKKIIERHGGGVWIEQQKEGGSILYFTLENKT